MQGPRDLCVPSWAPSDALPDEVQVEGQQVGLLEGLSVAA